MPDLIDELRELLVKELRLSRDPRTIDPKAYLFGNDLGLDSVDAVQVVASIEDRYGVEISDQEVTRFPLATLNTIAELLRDKGVGK